MPFDPAPPGENAAPLTRAPSRQTVGRFDPAPPEDEDAPTPVSRSRSFVDPAPGVTDQFTRDMATSLQSGRDAREVIEEAGSEAALMGSLGTIDRNEGFEWEGHTGNKAADAHRMYTESDPEYNNLAPADPALTAFGEEAEDEDRDMGDMLRDTANFLFSDELGLMGIKWDEDGFNWNMQHLRNQLVEHPLSTLVTVGSYVIPIGLAWQKGGRIATRAAKLAGEAGDVGAAAGKGLFGGKLGMKFDDHSRLVQTLAKPEANDGAKLFSDSMTGALAKATGPDEIADIVSKSDLNKMLIGSFHEAHYLGLAARVRAGDKLNLKERASWSMWEKFGNTYYTAIKRVDEESIRGMNHLFEKAQIGRFLAQAPSKLGDAGNLEVYKYLIGEGGRNTAKLAKKIGKENAEWTRDISKKWRTLLDEQYDAGFIDDATYELFSSKKGAAGVQSGAHIPAVKPDTPGFGDVGAVATESRVNQYGQLMERRGVSAEHALTGPTTKHRGVLTTRAKVMEAAEKGEIELDPLKLTMGGYVKDNILFQMHRNFVDMITDVTEGVSDKFLDHVMPQEAWSIMGDVSRKQWMNFDEMNKVVPGLGNRVRNMINAKAKKEGYDPANYANMPMVSRETVKQFFGHDGSGRQAAGMSSKFFELMTSVHKTSRTALNPATHMSNIVGNMMFIGMAGANPFSAQMLNDGKVLSKAYRSIAKEMHASKGMKTIDELMTPERLGKAFGDDRYITDKLGTKVDLAEFFSRPSMRELIDAQAFDSVEGLANVNRVIKSMDGLEATNWGNAAMLNVAKTIAGVGEAPGIKPLLNHASSAYLAEDMVPKMMYASHLLRKGWGEEAIVREIGRRLPQYLTVGNLPAKSRRLVLPWITFTSEATRIMKNNTMDRPVQMMAWMQAPHIAQSFMSATGLAPNYQEVQDSMDQAPHWAQKYGSVILEGESAAETLGAIGGGAVGGLAGTLIGGAPGAAMGAAGGATAGAAIGAAFGQDPESELRDFNRSWTMDFLPQSAMGPASTSVDMWNQALPEWAGGDPTTGADQFRAIKDLLPVEPLATFTPLMEVATGRGGFGQEISTKGGIEYMGKMALGFLGHLSPPIMQKWGMKITGENVNPLDMGDIFTHNGGQLSLPQKLTATFGGLAAAGTTFMATRSPTAAAAAGAFGAAAGSQMNIKKLLIDMGIERNPYNDEFADTSLDGVANTFFGVSKSWKTNVAQQAANDSFRKKRFAEVRSAIQKNMEHSVANKRFKKIPAIRSRIAAINLAETQNAALAEKKTLEWTEREVKGMMKSPVWKGWSLEDLQVKIGATRAMLEEKETVHGRRFLDAMIAEERDRSRSRIHGIRIVGEQ